MDSDVSLQQLKNQIQKFCEERNWDQFHNAKELSIGAITEASELLEHFRFQTAEQMDALMSDPLKRKEIGEELADVLFFILRFSQKYEFDLHESFTNKMKKNALKYPAEEFYGKNHKSSKR